MTPVQRNMARHALGLDGARKQSCRNRYFAYVGSPKEDQWNELCQLGLAQREKGEGKLAHFYLTNRGALMCLDDGEMLDPEDFDALPPAESR